MQALCPVPVRPGPPYAGNCFLGRISSWTDVVWASALGEAGELGGGQRLGRGMQGREGPWDSRGRGKGSQPGRSSLAGGRVIAPSPHPRTLPWNFQGQWVGSGVKGQAEWLRERR